MTNGRSTTGVLTDIIIIIKRKHTAMNASVESRASIEIAGVVTFFCSPLCRRPPCSSCRRATHSLSALRSGLDQCADVTGITSRSSQLCQPPCLAISLPRYVTTLPLERHPRTIPRTDETVRKVRRRHGVGKVWREDGRRRRGAQG